MYSNRYIFFETYLIILYIYKGIVCQEVVCPDATELSPYCQCIIFSDGWSRLDCSAVKNQDDLERVFTTVYFPSTNFNELYIVVNKDLKFLTRNVFGNVSFETIYFDATVLEYIDESVFVGSFFSLIAIDVTYANLVPQGFPFNSLNQYTSLNSLRLYGAGTFDVLPRLISNSIRGLDLENNKIRYLQDQVFDGLPNLENLESTRNNITSLSSEIFKNNPGLTRVSIGDNEISAIETGTFKDLLHLEKVGFRNNKITEIKAGAFYNLPKLDTLELELNELSFLANGTLAFLPSLRALYVDRNFIQFIDQDFLSSFSSLSFVNVDSNSLTSINPGTFDVMKSGTLYLSRNQLTTLEQNWLHQLLINNNAVYIEDNPLDCGCDMAWLFADVTLMTNLTAQCGNGTDIHDLDPLYYTEYC